MGIIILRVRAATRPRDHHLGESSLLFFACRTRSWEVRRSALQGLGLRTSSYTLVLPEARQRAGLASGTFFRATAPLLWFCESSQRTWVVHEAFALCLLNRDPV